MAFHVKIRHAHNMSSRMPIMHKTISLQEEDLLNKLGVASWEKRATKTCYLNLTHSTSNDQAN